MNYERLLRIIRERDILDRWFRRWWHKRGPRLRKLNQPPPDPNTPEQYRRYENNDYLVPGD